jgi:recombination associated protein RdgC
LSPNYPEDVVFLDLWQDKMFLGQEFLTWLWLASEIESRFPGPGGSEVEVRFEKKLTLEMGQGQTRSQVVCQNPDRDWTEAFVALGLDKKVVKGSLTIRTTAYELAFNLPADTLAPQSVKVTMGAAFTEDDEPLSQAGKFLNQVALIASLRTILDHLFKDFLKTRLSSEWTTKELPRLRRFLEPMILDRKNQD